MGRAAPRPRAVRARRVRHAGERRRRGPRVHRLPRPLGERRASTTASSRRPAPGPASASVGCAAQRDETGERGAEPLLPPRRCRCTAAGLATEAARAWTAHALEWLPDLPVVVRSRRPTSRRCARRSPRACEVAGTLDDGGDGADAVDAAAGTPGRGARLVRRRDPRVPARPVVRGERRRGSGGVPARARRATTSPRRWRRTRRAWPTATPPGVLLRAPDRPGRGRRVLGRRPQPAARAHRAPPTGS